MSTSQGKIFAAGNVIQNKWVILEFIGKGAMGEVYRAHQLNLQRDVAIKVVSQEWLRSLEEDEDEVETALQRFRREVQAMAQVRHPNVVQIFDHGTAVIKKKGRKYPVEFIAMEYIPGDTLRFTMSEEGFYPEQELMRKWLEDCFLPVLKGVEAIHALDMVHRDLKPENVLMDGAVPKITDFGLARSSRLKPVTQSMDVKGTAHYMSPEHFFDFRKADHRADIYSLGKILYEAIDGKINEKILPFKTAFLANPDTPFYQKLDEIVRKATAENKDERLDSVDKLLESLLVAVESLKKEPAVSVPQQPERISFLYKPRWIWSGIAIAVISVATMAFWHLFGESSISNTHLKRPPAYNKKLPSSEGSNISTEPLTSESAPAQSILAEDGATLQFISGGKVTLPENLTHAAESVRKVDSFYMDVAPVTNHQYAQFLNQNLSTLTIARGVVRADDEIWLLLGEIFGGYNPIVFRKGKFHVSNAGYASFPVLRVTANGAAAYARFYNRRLPTYEEWLYAVGKDESAVMESGQHDVESNEMPNMEKMHAMMLENQTETNKPVTEGFAKGLLPVSAYRENKYGIRAMDSGFGEWSLKGASAIFEVPSTDTDYMLMPTGVTRQPWEAFEEIGFRSAQNVERTLVRAR